MQLFLTGAIHAGKTTVIQHCLPRWKGPLLGFRTYKENTASGEAIIRLVDPARPEELFTVAHIRPGQGSQFWPDVFDTVGAGLLARIGPESRGLILMDEIGFIESQAPRFQAEILRVLDLGLPVLGALRKDSTPFLDALFARPGLTIREVTPQNRETLALECATLLGLEE